MAEICCEEAKSTPATATAAAAVSATAAAAVAVASSALERRRRRLEMRRFRIASDLEPPVREDVRAGKRQRLVRTASGPCPDTGSDSERPTLPERLPTYGVTSVCGRRREMEDAVSIRPDFLSGANKHHFFGVFDGHGCLHVATMCKDRMHEVVADEHKKMGSGEESAWKGVMERSFARLDEQATSWATSRSRDEPACKCEQQMPSRCDHVGSTAVVAIVSATHVVVANAGDSRAVLSRAGVPVPLSVDHKVCIQFSLASRGVADLHLPFLRNLSMDLTSSASGFVQPDRLDELARIEASGGRVIYWDGARVLGVLAMSRAIGDGYLKPYVSSEPEVTVTERTDDDECLILASDGLWDVVTNEMACEVVRTCFRSNGPPAPVAGPSGVLPTSGDAESDNGSSAVKGISKACSDAAMLLAKLALARRSADNVSVVVVDLRRGL
ncbi:probable protein phosphatase 2C 9 isoform X1 [Phragmites australis]|uniref:probable protein phosphatase 2C 9 isoform X1 n=1 Tax=Phragmites australis TaxID=29695 RepID=UPI002D784754|nr:probable protein phosphatase 2C 9 isoform X1 [Phragmites australis]